MKKRATQGFTLIELLVASGVTAIIVGLMITMVSNLLTAYNRSSGALSAQSQAGLVLDQLTSELESIVLRNSDDVMFKVDQVGTLAGSGKSSPAGIELASGAFGDDWEDLPIENYRFGEGGLWLKFFTSAPSLTDDPTPGVRAMGYRIDFNPVAQGSSESSFMLYRTQIPAEVTFDWGYDLDDIYPSADTYSYSYEDSDGVAVTVTGEENGLKDPNPALSELSQQIIADNVVDFGVRLFTLNDQRQRELVFPLDANDSYSASSDSTTDSYPEVVEVMVRILTPEGRRLIDAMRDNLLQGQNWWDVVDRNSEVYSRVIKIPSRPF
ncbi:MAG: PulJ/GspJ family protein [Puniceicoccales bacterium]